MLLCVLLCLSPDAVCIILRGVVVGDGVGSSYRRGRPLRVLAGLWCCGCGWWLYRGGRP